MNMKTKGVVFSGTASGVLVEDSHGISRGKVRTGENAFAIHKTFYHEGQGGSSSCKSQARQNDVDRHDIMI